ncbi:hypothetical protein [Xanthomonas sacchari]|uniref:hypothetical protein n=1 Tax=Xanthomonas sacchari TaxID=56458 RepID=UPI003B20D451
MTALARAYEQSSVLLAQLASGPSAFAMPLNANTAKREKANFTTQLFLRSRQRNRSIKTKKLDMKHPGIK